MKLLAVVFLLGLALASAVPLAYDDIESEIDEIHDELGDEFIIYAEGGLVERIKQQFEQLVERIKKSFDDGDGISENLMKKAQDFYKKLKDYGVPVSDRIREMFEDLRSRLNKNSPERADFSIRDLLRKLRDRLRGEFDVEKIREKVESILGKSELSNQILEMIKEKGGKARERILNLLNRILEDEETQEAVLHSGFFDKLKEQFESLVERMQKSFDEGNGISENMMKKAQDFYDKLKNLSVEISDKIKEIFENLKSKMNKNSPRRSEYNNKIRDLLVKLRDRLRGEFDVEKIREKVESILGRSEFTNQLLEMIRDKGGNARERILNLLNRILGDEETQEAVFSVEHAERSIITRLKERFENLVERLKKNFDDGKGVRGDLMKKANDVYEKLKNLGVEFNAKTKQVFEDLRSKFQRTSSVHHAEFGFFKNLDRLRQLIRDGFDAEALREKVESLFGRDSEITMQLIDMLREEGDNGRNRVINWIERILGENEAEKRSIKEIYEKIKNYFKDLNIELKERFVNFGQYVKEQYQKVLDRSKSDVENVKKIAEKFLEDGRNLSKDLAEEALEFFRDYKNDLGVVFDDIRDKVRDILKRKD